MTSFEQSYTHSPDAYQRHLSQLKGFSDAAGSRPMNPEYSKDVDYEAGYIDGQSARREYSLEMEKLFGTKMSKINLKYHIGPP